MAWTITIIMCILLAVVATNKNPKRKVIRCDHNIIAIVEDNEITYTNFISGKLYVHKQKIK